MKTVNDLTNSKKVLRKFFLLTFSLSWVAWIPLALSGQEVSLSGRNAALLGLLLAGAFSPSLVGIWMTYQIEDRVGRRDFWRRTVDLRRIRPTWIAFILLVFPAMMALTFLVDLWLGGNLPAMDGVLEVFMNPSNLLFFVISMLIGGPLVEELGWRGFALDKLLERRSPLHASLVLGVIHAAWHLPLFFIAGTSQGAMGIDSMLFWLWVVQVMAGSFFFTWVYLNNQRSILSAILLHFMSNATFTLVAQLGHALPVRTEIIRTMVTVLAVAVLTALKKHVKREMTLRLEKT